MRRSDPNLLSDEISPRKPQRHDSWAATFALALAAIAGGYALARGSVDKQAILALCLCFAGCLLGAVTGLSGKLEFLGDRPTVLLLAGGIVFQVGYLLTSPVGVDLTDPGTAAPFAFALTAATLIAGSNLSEQKWLGRWQIPVLLLSQALLGAWILRTSHNPALPVHAIQQEAVKALFSGKNPYSTWAFPYPPMTLLLDLPAVLLAGDHRYAQLVAVMLSGGFLAYARPGRTGGIAAALFLFTPRVFLLLQQGWTEPFLILLLSASTYCACRRPKIFPYVLGLFFSLKAYLILGLPVAALLLRRPVRPAEVWRLLWKAVLTGVLVTAPLAAWDWAAFSKSVGSLTLDPLSQEEPFSFAHWFGGTAASSTPVIVPFMIALAITSAALWRSPRTPAGFAAGLALTYLAFFSFHPEASFNHYYFVIGALCCAVAATGLPGDMVGLADFRPVTLVSKVFGKPRRTSR
jgi:hypothetical protein